MTVCPCCGAQVAAAALLVDLDTNTVVFAGHSVELRPPQVAELLVILHRAWPRTLSYELIGDLLWGMADDGRTIVQRRQHLATLASWARTAIGAFGCGLDIEAISGRGYRLVLPHQLPATAAGLDRRVAR